MRMSKSTLRLFATGLATRALAACDKSGGTTKEPYTDPVSVENCRQQRSDFNERDLSAFLTPRRTL